MSFHVCFSGNLACSGCNPCDPCKNVIREFVMPTAMVAAGFNQSRQQAEAFFAGFEQGWRQFHAAIRQNPGINAAVRITPVPDGIQPPQPPQAPAVVEPQEVSAEPVEPVEPVGEVRSEVEERRAAEERSRLRNMTTPRDDTPLRVEELLDAAKPASPKGAALGSVMPVGWVPRHLRAQHPPHAKDDAEVKSPSDDRLTNGAGSGNPGVA